MASVETLTMLALVGRWEMCRCWRRACGCREAEAYCRYVSSLTDLDTERLSGDLREAVADGLDECDAVAALLGEVVGILEERIAA